MQEMCLRTEGKLCFLTENILNVPEWKASPCTDVAEAEKMRERVGDGKSGRKCDQDSCIVSWFIGDIGG